MMQEWEANVVVDLECSKLYKIINSLIIEINKSYELLYEEVQY